MSKMVQTMDAASFEAKVLKANGAAVVDFWAPWCHPCKMMAPVVEELAEEYQGKITVGKIDLDEHPDVATRFNIMSIPTLIFFKSGKEVSRIVGVATKEEIIKKAREIA